MKTSRDKMRNDLLSGALLRKLLDGVRIQLQIGSRQNWFVKKDIFYVGDDNYPPHGMIPVTEWWHFEGDVSHETKPPHVLCYHLTKDHMVLSKSHNFPWIMELLDTIRDLEYQPAGLRIHRPNDDGIGKIEILGNDVNEIVYYHKEDTGASVPLTCLDLWYTISAIVSHFHSMIIVSNPNMKTFLTYTDLVSN